MDLCIHCRRKPAKLQEKTNHQNVYCGKECQTEFYASIEGLYRPGQAAPAPLSPRTTAKGLRLQINGLKRTIEIDPELARRLRIETVLLQATRKLEELLVANPEIGSDAEPIAAAEEIDAGIKSTLTTVKRRLSGDDKFERLMVDRTKLLLKIVSLGQDKSKREPILEALAKNTATFSGHLRNMYGIQTQLVQSVSVDRLDKNDNSATLLAKILDNHTQAVLKILDNRYPDDPALVSLNKSRLNGISIRWADYWTIMSLDPRSEGINRLNQKSTMADVMDRFPDSAQSNRNVFVEDIQNFAACLLRRIGNGGGGPGDDRPCLASAQTIGKHIDSIHGSLMALVSGELVGEEEANEDDYE